MKYSILIVEDDDNARNNIGEFLADKGFDVLGAATLKDARSVLSQGTADIILLDVRLPDGFGPDLLEEASLLPIRPPIIIITAYGEIDMAVEAMKNGAHDFIQKPVPFEQLEKSLYQATEIVSMRRELNFLRKNKQKELDFVIGSSTTMQRLVTEAQRAAEHPVSILITGETGTGKEVLARAIHQVGPRSKKLLIDVGCPNIPEDMFESELFGHEPGAFTDAQSLKKGLMEEADGSILFLDEVSAMPLDIQRKFLRALQERSFRRLGSNSSISVDIQIISASNKNLRDLIESGEFREDLYYRINVVELDIPPLRERTEDIPELVGLFLRHFNSEMGLNITEITPRAIKALKAYHWPGNIRELRNIIERTMIFCEDGTIDINLLPREITDLIK